LNLTYTTFGTQTIQTRHTMEWTMIEDPLQMTVVYHSRKKFYNGIDIYWYEFLFDDGTNMKCIDITVGYRHFLKVSSTKYYEFGGTHEDAIKVLIENGFSVVEGCKL